MNIIIQIDTYSIFYMPEQSIRVFVRVRPLTQKQNIKNNPQFLFGDQNQKQITILDVNSQRKNNRIFCFDDVFMQNSTQQQIFQATSSQLTRDVIQGYNGTIFAYGQTGSGKTYTMMGDPQCESQKGITARCFESILDAAQKDKSKDFLIMCSHVQLYNEQLRDLLHPCQKTKLQLRQSPEQGIFIKDLKKMPVTSSAEIINYLKIGNSNRTTGETLMNSESSRSHSIFTIYVESLEKNENIQKLIGSKFNLIDLAGSERQTKSGSVGDRFLQATKINLSLTALGKVISCLVQGRGGFIPYRDSKLTRLLQDSLGGNAKTVMIATVSACISNYEETVSTLKYASRAKYVTNVPIINLDPKDALLKQYESQIQRLRGQLKNMQKQDKPVLDQLIEQNKRIAKEAQDQKRQLITKIKKLQQQFISKPSILPQQYKKERDIREQKLSFMQKNYKNLQEEVRQMKQLLTELRRKYKVASKQIFQMENDHQMERSMVHEQFEQVKRDNLILKSVLGVLFTDKQLKNIIGLGSWQNDSKFKLPHFYFKDRHTIAFPCDENSQQGITSELQQPIRQRSSEKYQTTATSFGARIMKPSLLSRNKR